MKTTVMLLTAALLAAIPAQAATVVVEATG
jgi:hypothetical protein